MRYIKRKSAVKPITGSIVDTTNIDDKSKNTYSAGVIDDKISKAGGVEVGTIVGWDGEGIPEGYDLKKMGYSTEEQIIGTYLDKTFYRKVIIGTLPDDYKTSVQVNENINLIENVHGFIDLDSRTPINAYWTEELKSIVQQDQTYTDYLNIYYGSAFKGCTFKLTVEYTKTTDTGNFKYIEKKSVTPIEPKTGHIYDTTNIDNKAENTYSANVIDGFNTYSTEEQVIGTWIDGKPLYRKVINSTLPTTTTNLDIPISNNIETVVKISQIYLLLNGDGSNQFVPFPYINASKLRVTGNILGNNWIVINEIESNTDRPCRLIVEYTKTTN